MPIRVLELELTEEIKPVWASIDRYDSLCILVRFRSQPIGWVTIGNLSQPSVSREQLLDAIGDQLGWALLPVVFGTQDFGESVSKKTFPAISVIVCTRDRTDMLEGCLRALLALDYPNYEIIVVDNAPSNDATARLASRLPVRYVCEERPGLDRARNLGIAEARYDIIAFTDDDARPDRCWLQAMAYAFDEAEVMAVTGPVAPTELETTAQSLFEIVYGGMSQGFRRHTIRRDKLTIRELLWASAFGVGANMAFRRALFTAVGPFDVALDVGTPSGGGGDIEMFHRLVARGYTMVYEPGALVWHTHRRDAASLRRLVYNNGRSFGAYLLTCMRNRTVSWFSILRFAAREWLGWWLLRRLRRPGGLPRHLVAIELAGALCSLLAYRAAQAHARQIAARQVRRPQQTLPDLDQVQELPLVEAHQQTMVDVS